jgi:hypothetical protein
MLTLGIRFSRHEEPGSVVAVVTEKELLQIVEKNNGAKVLGETLSNSKVYFSFQIITGPRPGPIPKAVK